MKVGIEEFSFDAAHYTPGSSEKCRNLHGHTFKVEVEVEGEVDKESGMVLDFEDIRKAVKEVLKDWDHKFLVPEEDRDEIEMSGPFNQELKKIEGEPTTENIAFELKKEISEELDKSVEVKVYEGNRKYARTE